MSFVSMIMLVFALLGALDRILGNRFGLGREFERGFMLLGNMALSMIGMLVISPLLAEWMQPFCAWVYETLHLDPSLIPASLFANDMGGTALATELAQNEAIGMYNALVVSSMMGCTISFTIPYALGVVEKERHRELFLGLLCGIVTIPVGCFCVGLLMRLPFLALLVNLLPLLIFAAVIAAGLLVFPEATVKVFSIVGIGIKIIITIGLALGIVKALTGWEILPALDDIKVGGDICLNAAVVLSGAFPLMHVVSKLLQKPLAALGKALKINETAAMGFVSTLVTNATTFEMMNRMDKKGVMLNASFVVSAAFVFGSHLAFTMAFDTAYITPVIIAKLVSGLLAIVLATVLYKRVAVTAEPE
ncbi:MAG: ethanolamine utilization protein EutH [Clostridia bacterium]|nr:ethanolamine utilization protein EutH [Clostridia bacterium]